MDSLIRKYCNQIRKQHREDLNSKTDVRKKHWDIPAMATICHDGNRKKVKRGYSHSPNGTKWNATLRLNLLKLGEIGKHSRKCNYIIGNCSEQHAANNYMNCYGENDFNKLSFTESVRPRTMQIFPSCENCKSLFPNL
jgi:hypothetical protein